MHTLTNPTPVMHLSVTGKIYLHGGDVFALDICFNLYFQPFNNMGQTNRMTYFARYAKIVSEYVQEVPQSQIADNPMTPQERATQPSRDTTKTN